MVEALGGFDPKATYDAASSEYEEASRDYWQYLSTRTVDRLRLRPGERVLDMPCGTGASLIAAADRVGPAGRVVGIDYAEQMLAIARDKVRARRLDNVEIHAGDMTAIRRPDEPYDAVSCVLGIFFVDDMAGLVRSFRNLVRPGIGRVAVTVFGERFFDPMRDVFVEAVAQAAPGLAVVQPWRRTEDAAVLRAIFEGGRDARRHDGHGRRCPAAAFGRRLVADRDGLGASPDGGGARRGCGSRCAEPLQRVRPGARAR